MLVHRPEAVMGYTTPTAAGWASPRSAVETHLKWDAVRQAGSPAELRLADERAVSRAKSRPWCRPGTQQNPPRPVETT